MAAGIPRRDFARVSLLDTLARKVEFDRGESQLEAALAGEEHAERLDLLPQDPVLVRHLTYYATDGRPVMAVGIMEFRDGKVIRERIYFGEPWEPPAWRAQWVELFDPRE